MANIRLTGDRRRPMRAVIFEPRQSPDQDEVILDEVVLAAGEARDYEVRSATVGFRLENLKPEDKVPDAPDPEEIAPDQEGPLDPLRQKEIDAGKKTLSTYKETAPAPRKTEEAPRDAQRRETAPAATAQPARAVAK